MEGFITRNSLLRIITQTPSEAQSFVIDRPDEVDLHELLEGCLLPNENLIANLYPLPKHFYTSFWPALEFKSHFWELAAAISKADGCLRGFYGRSRR